MARPIVDPSSVDTLPAVLRSVAVSLACDTGEVLFRRGAPARHVYHLAVGLVRLERAGPDGEAVSLHVAEPGEYFAEASLHAGRYHCTAIALRRCEAFALPAAAIEQLIADDPAFARDWIATLSGQLRRTRGRVERLCLRSARERVLHLLATEGDGPDGRYRLRGTVKDLAASLGLSHEALYRTLAALYRSGEVVREGEVLRREAGVSASPARRQPRGV